MHKLNKKKCHLVNTLFLKIFAKFFVLTAPHPARHKNICKKVWSCLIIYQSTWRMANMSFTIFGWSCRHAISLYWPSLSSECWTHLWLIEHDLILTFPHFCCLHLSTLRGRCWFLSSLVGFIIKITCLLLGEICVFSMVFQSTMFDYQRLNDGFNPLKSTFLCYFFSNNLNMNWNPYQIIHGPCLSNNLSI